MALLGLSAFVRRELLQVRDVVEYASRPLKCNLSAIVSILEMKRYVPRHPAMRNLPQSVPTVHSRGGEILDNVIGCKGIRLCPFDIPQAVKSSLD